ncbi:tetratricopeptide repeat protein [Nocardiopsis exhalans]|uniref:Tetratricopeptide repeat protein n=1 Tax=Nocardiopsis exhalans TaxID=163604 RepID=A0ABY5D0N0_9ACTN|nr:tetratricopeptide repeat protein [Nocardiopsis exhalans]USY17852.1 tetratricopeptide repeat protein [Nocardiopsis exhalans]
MTTPTLADAEQSSAHLIDVYLPLAQAADRKINPRRWVLADYDSAAHEAFDSYEDALTWMDAAAHVIRGCIRIANATGRHEDVWKLAEALSGWLHIRKDFRLWRITHEIGEESARECGAAAHARMLAALGECHLWMEETSVAEAYLQRAHARWVEADHALGRASCLEALGTVTMKKGDVARARDLVTTARGMFAEQGRERGVILMTRRIGETYLAEEKHQQALRELEHAYHWFRVEGDLYQQVRTGRSLVIALGGVGRAGEAQRLLQDLIGIAEAIGAHSDAAELSRMIEPVTSGT